MDKQNNNQKIQIVPGKNGGARPGAGRPKGSGHKPKLSDNLTQEEKDEIVAKLLVKAREGDAKILQFLAEQIFGKAPASMDITSKGNELAPVLVKFLENGKSTEDN